MSEVPPLKGDIGSVFGVPVYTDQDGKEFFVTRTCPKCGGEFPGTLPDLMRCYHWECPACDLPATMERFRQIMEKIK